MLKNMASSTNILSTKSIQYLAVFAVAVQVIPITWPVTQDEVFTWFCSRVKIGDVSKIIDRDVHPPLYFWIVNIWEKVAGANLESLRFLSGIFGGISVVATVLLVDKLLSFDTINCKIKRRTTIFVLLLFACDASFVLASHYARMYSLMSMWAVLNTLSALLFLKSSSKITAWVGFTLSSLALLLTHHFGMTCPQVWNQSLS
jgi:uncharacterized membrane protein